MQSRHVIQLLALWINVFHIKNIATIVKGLREYQAPSGQPQLGVYHLSWKKCSLPLHGKHPEVFLDFFFSSLTCHSRSLGNPVDITYRIYFKNLITFTTTSLAKPLLSLIQVL